MERLTTASSGRRSAWRSGLWITSSTSIFIQQKQLQRSNSRHRPIGISVIGSRTHSLHEGNRVRLARPCVEFNDEAMEAIAYYAYEASSDSAEMPEPTRPTSQSGTTAPLTTPSTLRTTGCPSIRSLQAHEDGCAYEDRGPGHAKQQCPRDRAHSDDLQHHQHVSLHRARRTRTCSSNPTRRASSSS